MSQVPRNTPWRKVAVALFDAPAEAAVNVTHEIDVTDLEAYRKAARRPGVNLRLLHFFLVAIARTIAFDTPWANSYLRRGTVRQRKVLDLFVTGMVPGNRDLTGLKLRGAHRKTAHEVAVEIQAMMVELRTEAGRRRVDEQYALARVPWPFRRWTFRLLRWLSYDVGLVLPMVDLDPEYTGAATISDLSLYAFSTADAALFPGLQQSGIFTLCRPEERPVVREGKIVPRTMMTFCSTVDHRFADASHIDVFFTGVLRRLQDPEALNRPLSDEEKDDAAF